MTQNIADNAHPDDEDVLDSLPQQEEFYRAPVRFGSIPVEAEPKGWDRRLRFRKHYPLVRLPTQIVERVSLGNDEPHETNRLIWGDNLHVMRQIPTNSVDLIYIDPPFFSGRPYNVMWGDANEMRSFNDIWEGGMDGYLIWLNARLYEMKRILKSTGSIYVHCDWHASHYIKVELDKIFGHENFRNEIVWYYNSGARKKKDFGRRHDIIFRYSCSESYFVDFDCDEAREPYSPDINIPRSKRHYYDERGKVVDDIWRIPIIPQNNKTERIGYPTQKPEQLIRRIVATSCPPDGIVADFFVGGGTTVAVAQRLGRRWIACDQSRVAIAVTAERLKQQAITRSMEDDTPPDFTVEHWGIYEAPRMSEMPADQFRDFVLRAYGATRIGQEDDGPHIHGWRNQLPIWVGDAPLDSQARAQDVSDFANAIRQTTQYDQANLRDGIMLAWGFGRDAVAAAEQLRRQEAVDVNFVRIGQVRIGDDGFRQHVVGTSTDKADYSEFLTFIQPPVVDVGYRALSGQSVTLDAGDTAVVNPGAEIINVQWDFNHDGQRFTSTPGYSFRREGKGQKKRPSLRVTHKFPRAGRFRVACRVQDSRGGEATWTGSVEVK